MLGYVLGDPTVPWNAGREWKIPMNAIRSPGGGDRGEAVNASTLESVGNVAPSQGDTHAIQLANVVERQVGSPTVIGIDQLDFDLGDILAFVKEFGVFASVHGFLPLKSCVHFSGSGR